MKLISAMATVAGMTLLSRIAGFARDVLTANVMGAGPIADAFFVALKIPNFFRRVTGEGAFSVSFVPLYSEKIAKEGEAAGETFADHALSFMVFILVPFSLLMMAAMPWIITLIAPGFTDEKFNMAVTMTRLSFPYLLLISVASLMGAMLNAHRRFAPYAFAPVIFNLTVIASMFIFTPFTTTMGHAMALGVTASGILQCVWMYFWVKRAGLSLKFSLPELTPDLKKLFRLMGPGIIGAGVFQINLFSDMIIASLVPGNGAISYLYYADRLNQFPLSMIGIAIGTALLPMLSTAISSDNKTDARDLFNRSLEYVLILALPAAFGLLLAASPIIATIYQHGHFTAENAHYTTLVLMAYAVGLPAYIISKVFSTTYWAQQDTKTPVKIAIATCVLNIVFSLILIWPLGVLGIALSTGLVAWVQINLLYRHMKNKELFAFDARLIQAFPKICLCTGLMVAAVAILRYVLDGAFLGSFTERCFSLLALIAGAGFIYLLAIFAFKVVVLSDVRRLLKRPRKKDTVDVTDFSTQ